MAAAHTFFQANPDHTEMKQNLDYYRMMAGVEEEHFKDLEAREHMVITHSALSFQKTPRSVLVISGYPFNYQTHARIIVVFSSGSRDKGTITVLPALVDRPSSSWGRDSTATTCLSRRPSTLSRR